MSKSLKLLGQSTLLGPGGGPAADGVCYYMCNFIEEKVWRKPGSFQAGKQLATDFAAGTAMINYAKSQNLRNPQRDGYVNSLATLADNRIYRIWVRVNAATGDPNHEVILITGVGNELVFFDPNFGFYEVSEVGKARKDAFEFFLRSLYQSADSFGYLNVRGLAADNPLSFPV